MNHTGIFDDLNYMNMSDLEQSNSIMNHASMMVERIDEGRWKVWTPEPQFMDYVVNGMRNFLKSPFIIIK
jgi:hypothetical protein|tara:strand:+ start:459 stop:668 length:210 start_codon:yes stop_codon:yes gene_type:complete